MPQPLGTLEVKTLTLSMLAMDALEKAGDCSVLHASLSRLLRPRLTFDRLGLLSKRFALRIWPLPLLFPPLKRAF